MKRAIRWALLILLLGAAAGGGYWFYKTRTSASGASTTNGTYTQIVTAEQGNLTATISVVGQLEAVQSAALTFEHMSGAAQVLSLAVEAGNTVAAGQVLATIDPAPYQQALDQAKSDLQAAEQTLADLKTPPTALEIAQADLVVAQAEVQLQSAQSSLDDLLNPDIASLASSVTSAQVALAQAQQDQADQIAQQQSTAAQDQMSRLRDAEATAWEVYTEWVNKPESDKGSAGYQDKLTLLYNKMMDAKDQRVTAEVQAQVNALQAQITVRRDQQALADAQEALAKAKSGGDKLTQAQAKVAVQQAQVSLESAQEARTTLDEGADSTTVATAQADVDKKRLAVSDAEMALAGTKLVAAFDGTILQTHVKQGDPATANTAILTLANLKSLRVVASVDETTIRQVSAGQDAVIGFDAFPGQTFKGRVLSVPLQGTLQGGVTVYEVPLSLSGAEKLNLLVGMTANVEVQVGSVTNALLVPALALQKVNGAYQVSVPNTMDPAGQPETVPVEVGLSNGTYTQIVRGLNAGDQVIVTIQPTQSDSPFFVGGGPGGASIMIEGAVPAGGPPPQIIRSDNP